MDDAASGTSRRKALYLMGAAAAGLAALGADGVPAARGSQAAPPPAVPRPRAVIHPKPTPTPTPKPRPAAWTPAKLTTVKPEPIRELTELVPPPPANAIALTIDDGPSPLWTPRVLDLLAKEDVKATFFIIGEQVEEYPRLTRRIADEGHQICNHTMTHPIDIAHLSKKKVRQEIVDAHDRIANVTGVVPQFFRAPGGNWSERVLDLVTEHDMIPVDWAVDPRDWERPGVGRIRRSLLDGKAGNILLCHDGGGDRSQTLKALEGVIPKMKKRGLAFVAL
ncbi:polysaccharide deacetylase family protein [Spirillospora albida]|uniref:polysaccharide deacetylase family protein n=1 Tax=Spirillospora albida TaxID=58123 RepID=UPI001FE0B532|nr:polysaccharide deacetylase family protein [Spirillospora albida]